ncbi:TonB-dependent receptor plug domain-containing protein [Mucilaginibacter sp. BJC16-A38]|uniref:TonB-dependent receptor plug domain-containing protein n=1 Tax=Mucilaginibacter phenanthrenivorans TaxID=1234842 RepID=UPI002157DF7A|nr:TonB-dependent receptor plug domain-containing protein [Mucilaginibacter phenanthrenivorans]MCR8558422.1 TonB-dependent receptor plug domain-containing protein [Mucilaginibacter phenanthrenivorans]
MKKILILLTLLAPLIVFGQSEKNTEKGDTLINSITAKLNSYSETLSAEKAYLQFDKPYYAIGDTMYFKAYITIGSEHKLSALSGILYVDLLDPDNKITRSIKLEMAAGTAVGDFALPDTLDNGNYHVRAYTNWMRNNGSESFFDQVFTIGSARPKDPAGKSESAKTKQVTKSAGLKIDVQFFPEGGKLVAGNYSKIAFKAIAPTGKGTDIKGTVTDDSGTEICTFASSHLGMGAFNIVPEAGKTYKANITYADGTTNVINLPLALSSGYTIAANNTNPDTLRLRITAGAESPKEGLSLIAQSGGKVYYAVKSGEFSKFFTAVIPKGRFPSGIVQFTLFAQNGEPLNERLVFINNNKDQLKLELSKKETYAPRQKVKVELTATGKNKSSTMGSFSVAVTDETTVPVDADNENTILSNLLLTSELKGTVEKPNYYFANINEQTQADLDLLMLTQGYRQFEWKQVLNNQPPALAYQPEKSMEITGKVTKWGKPAVGTKVKLFSNQGGFFMLDTLSDSNGRFAFKDLVFADSTKFVVQSRVPKGQDAVELSIDTTKLPQVIADKRKNDFMAAPVEDMSAYFINQKQFYDEQQKYGINKHQVLLKEVKITASKASEIPHSQNLNGPGNADFVFDAKAIASFNCSNLIDCLSGRIPGMLFTHGQPPKGMAIIIDGNYMEPDDFTNLNPDDIEGIEVIKRIHYAAIYGSRMAGGGFIVTTKRGTKNKEYYRYAPGVVTYHPKGFYKAREFYSPQYDNPKTNQKISDYRSTVYWKPNVITDKDGKASFEYFNADAKGTYRMVIEGIDTDGYIGRKVVEYKVE